MILKSSRLFVTKQLKTVLELPERKLVLDSNPCDFVKRQMKTLTKVPYTRKNQVGEKDEVEEYDEKQSLIYNPEFERHTKKDKKSFLETVRVYKQNSKNRAGHVDFIKAALRKMEEFGVHRDIECYKKIIDVLPKGVYVCTNRYLVDGMYFPRQQLAAMSLIKQMGNNGVPPDLELGLILENIFGVRSHPCQQYYAYVYWSLKWKNKTPFLLPRPLPTCPLELAKLAIQRITSVDPQTEVSVFQTQDISQCIDKTWIVNGQSPKQRKLLEKHPKNVPVVVEGSNLVWLMDQTISYFVLKADGEPLPFIYPPDPNDFSNRQSKFFNPDYKPNVIKHPSVHEQDDGIIYGVCATGTSSKDSLLSWIRLLQEKGNPVLADIPVLFRIKQQETLPSPTSEELIKHQDPTSQK